jgi:hypothetical protein
VNLILAVTDARLLTNYNFRHFMTEWWISTSQRPEECDIYYDNGGTRSDKVESPAVKRRKLELNGPEVHANTTGIAPLEKRLHREVIREQNLAHIIQKTENPREPGPCFQCAQKRWSKKASTCPVCMVAIEGKSSKCA